MADLRKRETTVSPPEMPHGRIDLQGPPDQPEAQGAGNILATALPMMGSMGVMVFMAMSQSSNPRMLLMAGAMVFAMLSLVAFNIHRQIGGHRRKVDTLRREYLAYLAETRTTVRTVAKKQRSFVNWYLPAPDALVLVAEEASRMWEREGIGPDTLNVRLGSSTQNLAMELGEPEIPPLAQPDIVCHSAMSRFLETHSTVDDLAFGVFIGEFSVVELAGPLEMAQSQGRAMLMHLATFVPPTALKIAVLCSEERRKEWEWVKWLPHARSTETTDALGPARMVTSDPLELSELLGEEFISRPNFRPRDEATTWPHLLLVVDGVDIPTSSPFGRVGGISGVTALKTMTAWGPMTSRNMLRLLLHPDAQAGPGQMELLLVDQKPILAVPDRMGVAQAEAVARRLTSWSQKERVEAEAPVGRSDPKRSQDLTELLGCGDIRDFDPDVQWKRREGRDRLNIPFAVTPEGVPVNLDIKESAQQGMGPHGLLIGATGSGKSEVLRTVVLAMALTHSPEQLNFVLVDFKGGATFAGMSDLPHVSAMISNLESELTLVDRMQDALRGEMVRRQEVLRAAGNYANVTDYEADRIAGKHDGAPMPALFIILDEFSELLTAKPEFVDLFVAIGRLGRSLSIHLLLSSQRLESGRLKGLDSHLSYRIGLRTFSASESRDVLGVPDAYDLPPFPGVGYLKPGTEQMIRFRASYVAAPPPPRKNEVAVRQAAAKAAVKVLPFTTAPVLQLEAPVASTGSVPEIAVLKPGDERWEGMTEMDIAVERMKGKGVPAHQVWLPPLDVPDTMDSLMPDLVADPRIGLVSPSWRAKGTLRIPLGIIDLPLEQKREVLEFDFSGANGHFAVVGGPLTGKSTVLRSIVMALSLVHTPSEVQFYILDLGGGTFSPFTEGAHVAGVSTRDTLDTTNRMMAEIEGIVADREKYFRANRIDSMDTYRQGRAQGRFDDGYGDVFLVVDGWASMKTDIDGLDMRIQALMAKALTFGVHLLVATSRWSDLRLQVQDSFGSRLELRLGDTTDTRIDRKVAASVPNGRPGRGLEAGAHHVLVALPRVDGDHDPASLGPGVMAALETIAKSAPAPGPKLRMLPDRITSAEVMNGADSGKALVLGVEESRMGPFLLHPRQESHMYLYGDPKSGKTTFLRSIAQEIVRTHGPKEAQICFVDPRRSLLGQVPKEYQVAYMTTKEETERQIKGLVEYLRTRLPGDSVTNEQLRDRSWWTGAEVWVLVDDYDLVATGGNNPLAPLGALLPQAQDVGLHVIVSRRMGGAGRGFDPIIQGMNDLGGTGILLSGRPEEGPIIGRVKARKSVPGRAQVVSRDAGLFNAQMVWSDPVE
ncbi:type VII secretion protein EccCa [Schaalia sp. 19OD2882]|uniref:type VII secretion protein EccCa n=1 Tax=Schaalia sp. 19OD2882 TaxID=2794089 RepID=UPI001C1EE46F|nr:type VII secretion protein EccCa [Schaalia sp. 19OD2882]QWW19832.1 type VII secretion protein EccCa [Schaalia sp. 19OD2882]